MNIRDYEYIIAVAKLGNFGAAAKACNVSQPALSMQIKKLEDILGVQIFERKGKSFLVSDVGKQIIAKAEDIIRKNSELREIAKQAKDPYSGTIKLGAFPTLAPYYLPKIMPGLGKKFPKITFLLREEKTPELIKKLENGELDIALLAIPTGVENMQEIAVFDDEFLVALPTNHPLAKRKILKRTDIADEKILLLEDGHCLRNQALEYCEIMGAHEMHDFRATSMETLREMVASGLGITFIPEIAAVPRKNIVYIKLERPAPSRKIGLVFRNTHARSKVFKELAELLR
jgi:LysR family hydrogen peroxide-inducible transcriptional activator